MIKLFSWLLRRFITAFAVLVAVQLSIYILGLNLILSGYETNMLKQYEGIARQVLTEPGSGVPTVLPGSGPFFIFSADKNLIFSNKGKGKSITDSELQPVYINEKIGGYFHAGELGFTDNQTNRLFLVSIMILSGLAVILSLIIGFLSALFSTRKIAGPIELLREDIHGIRQLQPTEAREFEISELTGMSQDVSEAGKALVSQEEYKQQWLRDLAHDLRTPLSGLKSQLEAMSDGVLEPSAERFRRNLLEIERLENLAASIGELTAVESREDIAIREIDAKKFINQLISPWELELEQNKIKLEIDVSVNNIFGDEQMLLRALGNIMSNAFKYIEDGNSIYVGISLADRAGIENKGTIIEISNNGPDIPIEQRELIFTRLFRGESGRTSPGSGLGLSITREIIKLHKGRIEVCDLLPRGVRFLINLP